MLGDINNMWWEFFFLQFFFSIKREQTVIKFIKFDQIQLMDEKDWIREYD